MGRQGHRRWEMRRRYACWIVGHLEPGLQRPDIYQSAWHGWSVRFVLGAYVSIAGRSTFGTSSSAGTTFHTEASATRNVCGPEAKASGDGTFRSWVKSEKSNSFCLAHAIGRCSRASALPTSISVPIVAGKRPGRLGAVYTRNPDRFWDVEAIKVKAKVEVKPTPRDTLRQPDKSDEGCVLNGLPHIPVFPRPVAEEPHGEWSARTFEASPKVRR
jgi:hypothetical protein